MMNLKCIFIILLFPIISFGQNGLDSTSDIDNVISVYVFNKSKITLNGEKISIPKLDKHLRNNRITKAKIGTLKPTPLMVFPTFEKVAKLIEKYQITSEWYSDPDFQKPFFDDEINK